MTLAILLAALAAAPAARGGKQRPFVLLVTGDNGGEIEPCG